MKFTNRFLKANFTFILAMSISVSQNEIQNHSFETGDASHWSGGDGYAVTNDAADIGDYSMKMWGLYVNHWNGNWNVVHQDWPGVTPGDNITMQGKMMSLSTDSVSGGNNAWLELEFLDAAGTGLGESFNVGSRHFTNDDPLDKWLPFSIQTVVPENAATARAKLVYFQDDSTDGSNTYYPGSVYFDDIHVEYNYLSNPDFEGGAVDWNWTNANQAVVDDVGFMGNHSSKNWGGYYNAWEGNWTTTEQWINTTSDEGDKVRMSGYMMSMSSDSIRGNSYAYLEVTFYDADSNHLGNDFNVGSGHLNDSSPLDEWHYFNLETEVPANAQIAKANLVYRQSSPDGGATFEEGSVFFDEIAFACDGCSGDTTVVEVTIQLDMQNETVSDEGPHIGGGTWGDARVPLYDEDGDHIYETSLFLKKDSTYVYTFLNGTCGDYSCKENIGGQDCAYGQYSDRSFTVGQSDTTMPAYCFSSCEVCPAAADVSVTFQVDMQNEIVSDEGPHIGGGYFGDQRIPLLDGDNDGVYVATVTLPTDDSYMYVFLNGTCGDYSCKEDLSGDPCAAGQFNDREIQVGYDDLVLPPVLFGSCSPADLMLNSFDTDVLSSHELENSFWTYFDEVDPGADTVTNYINLTPVEEASSLGAGSGVMMTSYNISKYAGWGGFGMLYHVFDEPKDLTFYNQLSFDVYNTIPASISQAIEFRVVLYDASDASNDYVTAEHPRDHLENWYSFFKEPRFVDGGDGWTNLRVPLIQSDGSNPNYPDGFGSGPGDVGIGGNNTLDLDQIVGVALEIILYDDNPDIDIQDFDNVYGEFLIDDYKAILSFDVPGCTDVNACNYNPDATIDDGSCYDCVDLTWMVDFSNVPGDPVTTPAIGGGNVGAPGDEANAMVPVDGETGIFTVTKSVRENTTIEYTLLTYGCNDYSCKENISGQNCAVGNFDDRSVSVGEEDMTIMLCYGTCTDNEFCPDVLTEVTFHVNMAYEDVDPGGVWLAGGNLPNGNPGYLMDDSDMDGIWSLTLPVAPNSDVRFKYSNGPISPDWSGGWETVPVECAHGDGADRMVSVGLESVELAPVCFGACDDCLGDYPVDIVLNLDMNNVEGFDGSLQPYAFGSYNNWDNFVPQPMLSDDDGDGIYTGILEDIMFSDSVTMLFGYGENFESVPEECGVYDSELMLTVRYVPVHLAAGEETLVLPPIEYGGCPLDNTPRALFRVDVSSVVDGWPDDVTLCVTGSFDGWSGCGTELHDPDGDNVFEGIMTGLGDGVEYEYKFLANYGWGNPSTEAGAPLGSDCDWNPNDENNNYGFVASAGPVPQDLGLHGWGECPTFLSNEDIAQILPTEFACKAYPNPFNPFVNIYYELPETELVNISIINLLGQKVNTLANTLQEPGRYSFKWDGKDMNGVNLNSGIYFAVISRNSDVDILKITFLK